MTVLTLAVVASLCVAVRLAGPRSRPDFSDARDVFRLQDGVWTPAPHPPGGVGGFEVSRKGVVWTSTGAHVGLRRLDGDHWTSYAGAQFGTQTNQVEGCFALRDEELWAATGEGVVRFDGAHWRLYKEALKTNQPVAIVAGTSGVWVVDRAANLSHFDGTSWSIRNVHDAIPAADRGNGEDTDGPDLAMTGDGRVFIRWNGLWRQEGDTWREVRPEGLELRHIVLIGQDADRVWLARAGEVMAIGADGNIAARYSHSSLGIPGKLNIMGVVTSGGRIWVAAATGLLTFDGSHWRDLGRPPGIAVVRDVALAPDGSAWVVGERRDLARIAGWLAVPLGACAIALVVIGLLIAAQVRGLAENRLEKEQAVSKAAGGLPGVDPVAERAEVDRQSRSLRWMLPLFLVAFPVIAWAVSAPTAVLLLVAGGLWWWVSSNRTQPGKPSRYARMLWKPVQAIVALAIFFFVFSWSPLSWVDRVFNPAVGLVVKLALVTVLVTLVFSGRDIVAQLLTRAAWKKGDYDLALQRFERMSFGRPTAGIIFLEGLTHGLAGRPAEAERCYRLALAKSHDGPPSFRVRVLGCLGETMADQGRYAEAQHCLESAVGMGDKLGSSRIDLAGLLLMQGIEPQKALDLIEQAMRTTKGSIARRLEGWRWADKAWALALLGRRQEAADAIERALKATDSGLPLARACRHWTIGMALLAMEQTGKAIEHFRIARDADPKGKYGGRALQQLEQLSAAQTK